MPNSKVSATQALARDVRQLGWQRLAVAALLLVFAAFVALRSWQLPLLGEAENALYDVRAASFAPKTDTDKRVVLVVYTADTNRQTGQISPVDRTVLAQALAQIEGMGAKGIGIDVLLDSPQDDDALLQAALRGMTTPVFLAFAENRTNPEAITWEQEQDLRRYIAAVRTRAVGPASILLETDRDGVARRWPHQYPGLPALLSVAMTRGTSDAAPALSQAFAGYTGRIRYRAPAAADRPVFDKIPIDLVADPATAPLVAETIRGRYVLIGGDFADFDQFDTPFTRAGTSASGGVPVAPQMIGVEVHASMLAQLLDKALPRVVPGWALMLGSVLAIALGAATAAARARPWQLALAVAGQLLFFASCPFLAERAGFDTLGFPAVGWAAGWLIAYTAVSAALRAINAAQREFAQGALGKYLPRSVAAEILRNPERLRLHGEKRLIFCLFSDLEGFTKLTHAVDAEMIAQLLNDYLDRLSAVVLEHGGTLDKFVGDAVVAFWGAPIAYPDDGARAVRAAIAMYQAGEDFRRNAPPGVPPIGRTRVGVHYGEAIVGNFGGDGRIQYTALGDAMNTAARLESANKPLDTTVLVSREAVERAGQECRDFAGLRPMGTISLRGRATPVEVFEPVLDAPPEARTLAANLIAAHAEGNSAAVQMLTARIAGAVQKDAALVNLAGRLAQLDEGESYVLG